VRRRTQKDAYEYAFLCKNYYTQDNQWATILTGGDTKEPPPEFDDAMAAAAACYGRVPKDPKAILLLGDTKIRRDAEYVLNFGVSEETPENVDRETVEMILRALGKKDVTGAVTHKDVEAYRKEIVDKQSALARGKSGLKDVKFFGPGGILSVKKWSPVLNDSFILAGIHTNLLFVLALNNDEQAAYARYKPNAVTNLTKRYGGMSEVKKEQLAREMWLAFLRDNQRVLWDPTANIPRVFLRELLGLRAFGYTPQFSEYQLSFVCSDVPKADDANFLPYVEMLGDIGFKDTGKKASLIEAISRWLFDDADALTYPAASAVA